MSLIPEHIQRYAEKFSTPEPEVLRQLNRDTHAKILNPRMLSGHLQGRLLEMVSRMLRPERILEIGTYTGYSAICLARGLSANGLLHTIDHNPELEEFTRQYIAEAGLSRQIILHTGHAPDVIPHIEETFDLVFIDADKPNYVLYFDLAFEKLRKGGVIMADNVLWSGKVLRYVSGAKDGGHTEDSGDTDPDTEGIHAYNEHVSRHPGVENLLLPVRDGLMISMKK